jgi:hypothetical protein
VVGAPTSHIAAAISVALFALLWGIWPVASRRRLG